MPVAGNNLCIVTQCMSSLQDPTCSWSDCHYIGEKYIKQLVWPTGYWLLPHISLLHKGYSFNPLSPKSDQHQISPCNINAQCQTEWSWELRRWTHKMNLLDILLTSPHFFCRKWIGATNENSNFDLRGQRVNNLYRYSVCAVLKGKIKLISF